jgi:chaperone BCS1
MFVAGQYGQALANGQEYTTHGLLNKRGYLLYGPPGTGKSSLSLSIAGHFDLDIYILDLASVDDDMC